MQAEAAVGTVHFILLSQIQFCCKNSMQAEAAVGTISPLCPCSRPVQVKTQYKPKRLL